MLKWWWNAHLACIPFWLLMLTTLAFSTLLPLIHFYAGREMQYTISLHLQAMQRNPIYSSSWFVRTLNTKQLN